MKTEYNCPKCGKPMVEQEMFPGLYVCPDYKEPINFAPPFKFKCTGMKLTKRGAQYFEAEINRQICERN